MRNIWIANDRLTCIPGTKTFWHMLLEIPGAVDKTGTHNRFLAEKIENEPESPDLIIRNASFCRRFNRPEKTIAFFQDLPRDDRKDDVVYNAHCVVFNSAYTATAYINDWEKLPDITRIIPIGVNTEIFKPMAIKRETDRPVGIFVGDKGATKNTNLFEKIVKLRTDVDFIYVSKKNHEINLPNVRNVGGGVDEEKMATLYNQSDFILMTSPVETLHLSSIEAGFCNVPVIGIKTGWLATDDFDDANGLIVEQSNVESFSKAIDWIILHGKDTQLFFPRFCLLHSRYAWDNCKEAWVNLIEEIL